MSQRNRRITSYFVLFSLLILLGVVYAILQANLQINGTAKISENTWDIHFENIVVNQNSVPIGTGDTAATIDPNNDCKVDFEVTLSTPGDFYEFTVDVVNDGTIDGMIGSLVKTLKVDNVVVETIPEYLIYTVTYEDGTEILENHLLEVNSSETYLVHLEFSRDIDSLPVATMISTSLEPQFIQANSESIPIHPVSFADDDWVTIITAVKSGNISAYHVGDTKTIELGNDLGTHTLRIANTTTPSECSGEGFSQTACGFVIEFADIIISRTMHSVGTNVGGWPVVSLRNDLNNTNDSTSILNSLPEVLRNAIIDTTVISGHGSTAGETNFTSIDKLYLLSTHEVMLDDDEDLNYGIDYYDTAYYNTRQLDYYAGLNITTSSYSDNIKQYNGTNSRWWLRSADYTHNNAFCGINVDGYTLFASTGNPFGVSPAFRLG